MVAHPFRPRAIVRMAALHCLAVVTAVTAGFPAAADAPEWTQWRGPTRNGHARGPAWPKTLSKENLTQIWRVTLAESYSGPIVTSDFVYTTESRDKKTEAVVALERATGKEVWRMVWEGAITVPFFATRNGSWIRSTPAYDGQNLYIAGMKDVLVCLDARTGAERWRVDFVKEFGTPAPAFGFVCSPLVDGDAVYVQAGASFIKLAKDTGKAVWRTLEDGGGMMGSAFSSPVIAELHGRRQIVVQTREKLAGIDPADGKSIWQQPVPSFRGMNILTPIVFGDGIFTSTYQNKSWLYRTSLEGDAMKVVEAWTNPVQCYMSTPVVIDGRAYAHLQNRRFACIDLASGERLWTSQPQSEYCSLVAHGDRILALGSDGRLFLLRANPVEYELLGEVSVSDAETWGHLAVSGDELVVRELGAISLWRWKE